MTARALEPGYFDALYAADPDPWRFATSAYEDAKYAATLAAMPRARYANAVEIGCSIGVLTARLAPRCAALLGVDAAAAALVAARARCAALPHVDFAQATLPGDALPGRYDLLLLSEILYYFDPPRLAAVAATVHAAALPGADVILVHWLGPTPDYPLSGDEAVTAFLASACDWADVTLQSRTADYRLDVLRVR